MATLGIAVSMNPARPVVSCVLLDGSVGEPSHVDSFDLKTASDHVMDQADDLGQQLSSKVAAIEPDSIVIRVADFAPRANRTAGPRNRLLIEGALGYACRRHVALVDVRTGKEVGQALGISKQEAEAIGRRIDRTRAEATAAALSSRPR